MRFLPTFNLSLAHRKNYGCEISLRAVRVARTDCIVVHNTLARPGPLSYSDAEIVPISHWQRSSVSVHGTSLPPPKLSTITLCEETLPSELAL